jgi:hypothetical protein
LDARQTFVQESHSAAIYNPPPGGGYAMPGVNNVFIEAPMLGRLFSSERHIQMVNSVYQGNTLNEEKLSKLITYLKSRTSNISRVLDYLEVCARSELCSSHQLKTTARILRAIIDDLKGASICYESRVTRMFITIIREILKLKEMGRFEYSDHQEFLDLFSYFFGCVPIRTYKSEKYIRKILLIATCATRTIADPSRSRYHLTSEDSLSGGEGAAQCDTTESESSDMVEEGVKGPSNISDPRFDFLFLEVIDVLTSTKGLLRAGYDEKYNWLGNSLVRQDGVNSTKRREILRGIIQKATIVNSHSLLYYILKYSSIMGAVDVWMLAENLQPSLFPQIVLQANLNILERGEAMIKDGELVAEEDQRLKECRILVRAATDVLLNHELSYLNQREIELSFFSILRIFFSTDLKAKCDFSFLTEYLRRYFEKSMFISEIFYGFLKRISQGQKKHTAFFKLVVYEEIQRYYLMHEAPVANHRTVLLLLNAADGEFAPHASKILVAIKGYFTERTTKPAAKEAVAGRLRAVFYKRESEDILSVLVHIMKNEPREQYKTLCLLREKGYLTDAVLEEVYGSNCGGYSCIARDKFDRGSLEGYDLESDEKVYNQFLTNLNKGGPRIKADVMETFGKRESRIRLVEYD